jgi:hypothetical protein
MNVLKLALVVRGASPVVCAATKADGNDLGYGTP